MVTSRLQFNFFIVGMSDYAIHGHFSRKRYLKNFGVPAVKTVKLL